MNWGECVPLFTRRRGIHMHCDKVQPALYFPGSREELTERLSPQRMQEALAAAGPGATRREVFAHLDDDSRVLHAVMQHEMDHLRRQFSTPAGLLQWAGHSVLTTCAVQLLAEFQRQGIRPERSLMGTVAKTCAPCPEFSGTVEVIRFLSSAAPLERAAVQVECVSHFMAGMDGDFGGKDEALQRHLVLSEAGLLFLDAWVSDRASYQLSAAGMATEQNQWEEGPWVGARHLLEGFAIQEEASHLARLGGDGTPYAKLIVEQIEYRLLLGAWHRKFPSLEHSRSGNLRKDDLMLETWRILPVEAYAAADLALWVPFGPEGLKTQGQPLQWLDVQPGWRFSAAMAVLENMGGRHTGLDSPDREQVFEKTQADICKALDWTPPRELAAEWRNYFATGVWHERGLFLGNEHAFAPKVAAMVLEKREVSPFDVVLNNLPWATMPDLRFPLWVTDEPDGRQVNRTQDTPAAHAAYASTLQSLALQRLLFPSAHGTAFDALVVEQQREAIGLFAAEMEAAGEGLLPAEIADILREITGVNSF